MPKERLQIGDQVVEQPGLRPAAAPVDTYQRTNAGDALSQLASSLSQFSPTLGRLSSVVGDVYRTDQTEAGIAEARRQQEQGKKYKDMIADGSIPRGASPFFVQGFHEQAGRVAADKWQGDLTAAMAQDPNMKTTTNIADFDAFTQKFRQQWLQDNVGDPQNRDAAFERGFGFRSDEYTRQLRETFAHTIADRVEQYADDTHFSEVIASVEHDWNPNDPAKAQAIADGINKLNTDLIAQGRDPGKLNHTTVDAIIAAAETAAQKGDRSAPQMLDILSKIKAGTGTLDQVQYGRDALLKAKDTIDTLFYKSDQEQAQKQAQQRETVTRTVLSTAVQSLVTNPNTDLKPFALQLAQSGDPAAAAELNSLADNIGSLKFKTDKVVMNSLFSRIWNNHDVTEHEVVAQLGQGNLTVADAAWLNGQIAQQQQAESEAGNRIFGDYQFEQTMQDLDHRFADPVTGIVAADKADRVAYAKAQLMQQWAGYMQGAGATATPKQRETWLTETADSAVKYFRGNDALTINPARKPALEGVDPLKTAVLSHDDVVRITQELHAQQLSPETLNIFSLWHLDTPKQRADFLKAQAALAPMRATSDSSSTATPNKP